MQLDLGLNVVFLVYFILRVPTSIFASPVIAFSFRLLVRCCLSQAQLLVQSALSRRRVHHSTVIRRALSRPKLDRPS